MIVGVLGGGQLGMMLGEAAQEIGITCRFFDPNPDSPAQKTGDLICASYDDKEALTRFKEGCDVITYEFENVPVSALAALGDDVRVFPPAGILEAAQDRLTEKELLTSVGIATAPFTPIDTLDDLTRSVTEFGTPCVLKTRRLGYDGKGQVMISSQADIDDAWKTIGGTPMLLEGYVPFDRELSVIAVRGRDGATVTYPLVENHHRDGILRLSLAPARSVEHDLQKKADAYAKSLMTHVNYVGTMVIELFEAGGELIANEIAPRVHNSGHWTIEGAKTSQFGNHLRAVAGMSLEAPRVTGWSAMLNLIGEEPDLRDLTDARIQIHSYGKTPRPGRKLGHVTITAPTAGERNDLVRAIAPRLGLALDGIKLED